VCIMGTPSSAKTVRSADGNVNEPVGLAGPAPPSDGASPRCGDLADVSGSMGSATQNPKSGSRVPRRGSP